MIRDPADRISAVRFSAALFAVLLGAFALQGTAAPFVVRLGPDRLVLDAPAGFSDSTSLASPRLQELAEGLTSPSNRILLFALTDGDMRRFMAGDPPGLRRHVLAAVPARLEREQIGASQFAALAQEATAGMGEIPALNDPLPYLDARPHGERHVLAQLRREPFILSVLQGTRIPARRDAEREKPQYVFSTTTLLLVRGKPLTLSVFTGYDGPADVDWLRSATRGWVDDLLRLNRGP